MTATVGAALRFVSAYGSGPRRFAFSAAFGDDVAVAVEVRTDVTGQAQSIGTPNIGAVRN